MMSKGAGNKRIQKHALLSFKKVVLVLSSYVLSFNDKFKGFGLKIKYRVENLTICVNQKINKNIEIKRRDKICEILVCT